jgi:arabinofuranan 3-O-arabinosyltransferase
MARSRATLSGPPDTATSIRSGRMDWHFRNWPTWLTNEEAESTGKLRIVQYNVFIVTLAVDDGTMLRTSKLLWRFFCHPLTRYLLAWLVVLNTAVITGVVAWSSMDEHERRDGNSGHATIDFGGQWLMGRMVWSGLGEHLYHRNYQREIVAQAYPRADEVPEEQRSPDQIGKHDTDLLMAWFMGKDDPDLPQAIGCFLAPLSAQDPLTNLTFAWALDQAKEERFKNANPVCVGGPLYPPIQAVAMSPLAHFSPRVAYRIVQILSIVTAFLAGWGICLLSRGRLWWPVATTAILLFPGFSHNLNLGQNAVWTVTLLIFGWALIARGRPLSGGVVWGLLAYKPVWAAAFFLVPLWTGRWRVCVAMVATAACLIVATLPFVGWHSWIDWLQVGRYASQLYQIDENWILLSRDLITIPRRWLLDFKAPPSANIDLAATLLGSCLLLATIECTTRLAVFRKDRSSVLTGPGAAFLLLGAWAACFHFMYYDVLLAALPVLLLLLKPEQFLEPRYLMITTIPGDQLPVQLKKYFGPRLADSPPIVSFRPELGYRSVCVANSIALTLIALLVLNMFLFAPLSLEASIALPLAADGPIPMPLKYSTSARGTPLDTFLLILLWLWCGWSWARMPQVKGRH